MALVECHCRCVYSCENGSYPNGIQSTFAPNRPYSLRDKSELRSVHSKYDTRNCHDLQVPRINTERAKNGFKYSALKLWNDLPVDILEASTLKGFKKKLKAHLLADQK